MATSASTVMAAIAMTEILPIVLTTPKSAKITLTMNSAVTAPYP
jgi:hypothetical protein